MSRKFLTPVVLPADPTAALEAATKQYVDAKPRGIVAVATMVAPGPVSPAASAQANLSQPLAFTPVVGRRYRAVVYIRATQAKGGTTGGQQAQMGITNWPGSNPTAFINMNLGFSNARLETIWLATNATPVSLTATGTASTAGVCDFYTDLSSCFYIEDVGAI